MGKILGLGALFIGALMVTDLLTHPAGVTALGTQLSTLEQQGGNQLIGVAPGGSAKSAPGGAGA